MIASPEFNYCAERGALEAALETALAELPALRQAAQAAAETAHDARWRFQLFQQRCAAATRGGADLASPALLDCLEAERRARDKANAAAERARREVANCEWRVGSLRGDIQQLTALEKPPLLVAPRPEIVRRPKSDLGEFDPIVVPLGRTPPDAA
jgi:hypothetical protein